MIFWTAVLLLVLPAAPVSSSAIHQRSGAFPESFLVPAPSSSPAASFLTASNLTWNYSIAHTPRVSLLGSCGRQQAAMAADGPFAVVFVSAFTGASFSCTAFDYAARTLRYNETNNTWWTVTSAVHPPPLANFSLASDTGYSGGVAVLFDGENLTTSQPYNGTWLFYFGNSTWRQIHPAGGPSARSLAAVAADPTTNHLLVIGGVNFTSGSDDADWWDLNLSADTWSYVGSAPQMIPGTSRLYGASLLSNGTGRFLLFGGCSSLITTSCSNLTADLYATSGGGWGYALNTTEGPAPRAFASWLWDPAQRFAMLFGGERLETTPTTVLGDTWVFLPGRDQWVRQSTPPTPSTARYLAAASWLDNPANETGLLVGGLSSVALKNLSWRISPTIDVTVNVTNSSGGRVPGANVTVFSDGYRWTGVSNASGVAYLPQVASGPLEIVTNATGYYQNTTFQTVPPAGSLVTTARLVPLPILRVRTFERTTLGTNYLGAVDLLWNGSTPAIGTSDSRGYWNHTAWHGGPVNVTGQKRGYSSTTNSTTLPTTGVSYLNLTLRQLSPANLSVRVISTVAVPIAGAVTQVSNLSQSIALQNISDNKGYANFTGLPGIINVTVAASTNFGFYNNSTRVALSSGNTTHVNLTLTPWPTLHVRVLGGVDGGVTPVALIGANVDRNGTLLGSTGSGGWLNVTTTTGQANLLALAQFFYPGTLSVTLNHTGPTNVTLLLVPWPALHVHVWGNQTQAPPLPLPGARVESNRSGLVGLTNLQGWSNTTVPSGATALTVTATAYRTGYRNVTLNYTGILNVTFFLNPLVGTIHVHVVTTLAPDYHNGTIVYPLSFATVNYSSATGTSGQVFTNGLGWANSTLLQGNYTFTAWKYGMKPAPNLGPFFVGQVWMNFTLYPIRGANVSALVQDRNTSAPIANATVEVGPYFSGQTNLRGWANLTDILPPGRYEVLAYAPGYEPNQTNVSLTFHEVIPRLLIKLTPIPPPPSKRVPGNTSFSLVPPAEQYTWWPFLILPVVFALGAVLVILSQRSSRRGRTGES